MQNIRRRKRGYRTRRSIGRLFDALGVGVLICIVIVIWIVTLSDTNKSDAGNKDDTSIISINIIKSETDIKLYNADKKCIEEMPLETYVCQSLAAEVPALFNEQALEASAVAIRTIVVRNIYTKQGCSEHPGADVCSDSGHCQAYMSSDQLQKRWGSNFDEYNKKIKDAVIKTAGMILIYNDAPILALYHSNSINKTEDCVNVFNESFPYLVSVDSPSDPTSEYYSTKKSYSTASFISLVNSKYSDAKLSVDELRTSVKVLSRFESGRVDKLKLGNVQINGYEARKLFDLKSANFYVGFSGDNVIFDVMGSGHGVGMSQVGANTMAESGSDFKEILEHYYPGTQLKSCKDYI